MGEFFTILPALRLNNDLALIWLSCCVVFPAMDLELVVKSVLWVTTCEFDCTGISFPQFFIMIHPALMLVIIGIGSMPACSLTAFDICSVEFRCMDSGLMYRWFSFWGLDVNGFKAGFISYNQHRFILSQNALILYSGNLLNHGNTIVLNERCSILSIISSNSLVELLTGFSFGYNSSNASCKHSLSAASSSVSLSCEGKVTLDEAT